MSSNLWVMAVFLINLSGSDFSRIWVAPHKTNHHWQRGNGEVIKKGTGAEIKVDPTWASYDLRVQYTGRNYEIWEDFDARTKLITITVLPDARWQAHFEK